MAAFAPTHEQEKIAEAVLEAVSAFQKTGDRQFVKVSAYAGTGKTSTLKMIAEMLPNQRILYLAFNKAIKEEAAAKFPKNVKCMTGHGLAYGPMKRSFIRDRKPTTGTMEMVRAVEDDKITYPVREIANRIGLSPRQGALVVVRTLIRFAQTAAPRPLAEHVPAAFPGTKIEEEAAQVEAREVAAKTAGELWEAICAPDSRLPINFDFFLKAYALKKPKLPYDLTLYDEAQDANDVVRELIERQQAVQVYCGDENQAIYSFRGAINAMEKIPGEALPLTKSWRFGPEVAGEANLVLRMLGTEMPLEGGGRPGRVIDESELRTEDAVLCRGNAGVIEETLAALDAGRKAAVVGGTRQAAEELEAAYDLYSEQRRPQHPELALFADWGEFAAYVETDEGASMKPTFRTVERYQDGVPNLCRRLRTEPCKEEYAEVVISTSHKAKGREWEAIRFAGDFGPLTEVDDETGKVTSFKREEAHLLYVSLTRAMGVLNLAGMKEQLREDARRMRVETPTDQIEEHLVTGDALPFFDPPDIELPGARPEADAGPNPAPASQEAAYPEDPPGAPTLADLAALEAAIHETQKLALEMWAKGESGLEHDALRRLDQLQRDMHAARKDRVDAARHLWGEKAGHAELRRMLDHPIREPRPATREDGVAGG